MVRETGGVGGPASTTFPAATTVTPPMATTTQMSTTTPPRSTSVLGEVFCDQSIPEPGAGEMLVTLYEVCHEGTGTGERLEVVVGTDGAAVIDLDRASIAGIANVSTTTAGDYFRGQLYGTVFAFADITTALCSLDGSSSGFCVMMELVPECVPVTRSQWDALYSQTVQR